MEYIFLVRGKIEDHRKTKYIQYDQALLSGACDNVSYKLGDRTVFLEQDIIVCEKQSADKWIDYRGTDGNLYYLRDDGAMAVSETIVDKDSEKTYDTDENGVCREVSSIVNKCHRSENITISLIYVSSSKVSCLMNLYGFVNRITLNNLKQTRRGEYV